MAKVKRMKIHDILQLDKKLYKVESVHKHPYMSALRHICHKTGNKEIWKCGYMTPSEAFMIVKNFKAYKEALPSRNRRYTAAQITTLDIVHKFALANLY